MNKIFIKKIKKNVAGNHGALWIVSQMAATEEWDFPISGAPGGSPNIEDE